MSLSKAFKLGEYSNDPKEHEAEIAARQQAVTRDAGDYVLQQTPQYLHWRARRKDGKPMPKALDGIWTSPGHFKAAVEKFQSKQIAAVKHRADSQAS